MRASVLFLVVCLIGFPNHSFAQEKASEDCRNKFKTFVTKFNDGIRSRIGRDGIIKKGDVPKDDPLPVLAVSESVSEFTEAMLLKELNNQRDAIRHYTGKEGSEYWSVVKMVWSLVERDYGLGNSSLCPNFKYFNPDPIDGRFSKIVMSGATPPGVVTVESLPLHENKPSPTTVVIPVGNSPTGSPQTE